MGFFGIIMISVAVSFTLLRSLWVRRLEGVVEKKKRGKKELANLTQRHSSRLESLHHLEKQVSGLLDLFESARDFSECLSLDAIAALLCQRVLPDLPFQRMKIIQQQKALDGSMIPLKFEISADGVKKMETPLLEDEEPLRRITGRKQMLQDDENWIFPLIQEENLESCMVVEGAEREDLAKFEVLVSYLILQAKKVRLYETVRDLSIRDELTGVFVRRHFLERFEEELRRSIKHDLPLAVLMLDIDHFKRYNDEYGHLAGDSVLKQVTHLLQESLRKVDIVARYGGEEFIVILPESKRSGAFEVAERIRSSIARNNFRVFSEETRVTISLGISLFPDDIASRLPSNDYADLAFDLVQCADKALYRAKEEGRNRVIVYHET